MHRQGLLLAALPFLPILPAARSFSSHNPYPSMAPLGETTRATPSDATLTLAEPSAPDTLNPLLTRTAAGVDAAAPVFDSLVRLDGSGTFRPDLAVYWHRSVDARTWTFTLNPRARWQDGVPVTAADVAFTIGLARDARFGAASTLGFDSISSVKLEGTDTVTVTLSASYAPFLATVGATPILPRHILGSIPPAQLRSDIAFNRRPIGSGPFTVAEVTGDGHVVEEANRDYFGQVPSIGRLVFAPVGSRKSALDAARRDPTLALPPSLGLTPRDVAGFNARADTVDYTPSFAWTHLDLIEHGALADVDVRRALAYATPRDEIVAQVLRGHGHIDDGDQAPGTSAYAPKLHNSYRYNPHAARELLAKAGYKPLKNGKDGLVGRDDKPLTITLWADQSCPDCAATLSLIAKGWRAAGVSTTVRLVPTASLFGAHGLLYNPARFTSGRYDAVLYTWINGPDPDDAAYWTKNAQVTASHPLGGNFTGYDNPLLDKLATDAIVTPDGPGRDALYRRIQGLLVADEPDIFLYWADDVSVIPRALRGYAPTPYESAATWDANSWSLG